MTTSEKLSAVIEAQERGGHYRWSVLKDSALSFGIPESPDTVIACLLDPEGLKAAYGDTLSLEQERRLQDAGFFLIGLNPFWKHASHAILDAWLSSGAEGATNTAFDLLPSKA